MSELIGQEQEYERMRGEYLSLMASLEFNLTLLLSELLDVQSHRQEFEHWLSRAPIPFSWKVGLFESLTNDNGVMHQFGDLASQMRGLQDFRNTLAHSFRQSGRTLTARGKEIAAEQVTSEALQGKLIELQSVENLMLNMWADINQGPLPPTSADDFADWPI